MNVSLSISGSIEKHSVIISFKLMNPGELFVPQKVVDGDYKDGALQLGLRCALDFARVHPVHLKFRAHNLT